MHFTKLRCGNSGNWSNRSDEHHIARDVVDGDFRFLTHDGRSVRHRIGSRGKGIGPAFANESQRVCLPL